MDDNMLLVTGIGFLILSALLVYLGVRLFMLLFKKCEQNRKHLAIFIIIFLFVTAILCAATYLYNLFLGLSLGGSYVCCMPYLAELLLMLMPLLLFVIPFALSCFVSFVVLLIRKKLSSVTFLLCGILLCIFVMFHSLNKCLWCREVYWIQSWYMFLLLHHNEHRITTHRDCSVCDEYRGRYILHRQSYCSHECKGKDYFAKGICTGCDKPRNTHPIVTRVCRNSECRTVIYQGPECPTMRGERRISVYEGYCSACWEKEWRSRHGEVSTSEESCLPKDDVLEKNRRKRLDE